MLKIENKGGHDCAPWKNGLKMEVENIYLSKTIVSFATPSSTSWLWEEGEWKNMKHLLICTRLYGNWNNISNEFIPWANMTGAEKQIENTGERAYSYVHTSVFMLHNQQNISPQKWIISWNIHLCIFVLQDLRVCNIKHASVSWNIWIHQTICSNQTWPTFQKNTTETLVVFQGRGSFPLPLH